MQQVIYSAMPYCIAQRADRIARLYIMSDVLSQLQSLRRRLETQYRTKTQPKKIKKSSSFSRLSCNPLMAGMQKCYFPDGSEVTSDTPCQSSSTSDGASACCNSLDVCLESHLCLAQNGAPMISRGSCTDKTWQSQECSQYCADGKPHPYSYKALELDPGKGLNMTQCSY